jgi:hypothetical protein
VLSGVASLPSKRQASASPLESFCVSVNSIRSCALRSADPPSIVHLIVHDECNALMTQLCDVCDARMGSMPGADHRRGPMTTTPIRSVLRSPLWAGNTWCWTAIGYHPSV